jgi:hypothetical protein
LAKRILERGGEVVELGNINHKYNVKTRGKCFEKKKLIIVIRNPKARRLQFSTKRLYDASLAESAAIVEANIN